MGSAAGLCPAAEHSLPPHPLSPTRLGAVHPEDRRMPALAPAVGRSRRGRMSRSEVGGAPDRQQAVGQAGTAGHRPHQEGLVVTDAPAVDDGTLPPRRALAQHGHAGDAGGPVTASELVHRVAGLLAEQGSHFDLILAEQVEGDGVGALGHEVGVVDLGDADQEPGWRDTALRDEAGHTAGEFALDGSGGHHMEGKVDALGCKQPLRP